MDSAFEEIRKRRNQVMEDWNRVLPTNELLYDRWEKAKFIGAGEGSSIYDSCLILGNVKIGKNTWIGPFTVLDGSGEELVIGDSCSIGSGVQIYTHEAVMWTLSGGEKSTEKKRTIIGNNCHVSPMSLISMGVTIGDQCIIAANSFVNKSFPGKTIIAGTPAKKIGEIFVLENGDIQLKYEKDINKVE